MSIRQTSSLRETQKNQIVQKLRHQKTSLNKPKQ